MSLKKDVKMAALPKFILGATPTQTLTWCSYFQSNVKIGKTVRNNSRENLDKRSDFLPDGAVLCSCGDERAAGSGQGKSPADALAVCGEPDSGHRESQGKGERPCWGKGS